MWATFVYLLKMGLLWQPTMVNFYLAIVNTVFVWQNIFPFFILTTTFCLLLIFLMPFIDCCYCLLFMLLPPIDFVIPKIWVVMDIFTQGCVKYWFINSVNPKMCPYSFIYQYFFPRFCLWAMARLIPFFCSCLLLNTFLLSVKLYLEHFLCVMADTAAVFCKPC